MRPSFLLASLLAAELEAALDPTSSGPVVKMQLTGGLHARDPNSSASAHFVRLSCPVMKA